MTLAKFLEVFFIAATPIAELRAAIPDAINHLDMPWYYAYLIAVAGNLFPIPFLLLFLNPLSRVLSRISVFDRILRFVFKLSRRRADIVEKHGMIGLALFVAVPLPATGAWTGAIIAFLLGMKFKRAFPAIVLGVLIAGIIVTVLTLMGWVGAIIALIALAALIILGLHRIW